MVSREKYVDFQSIIKLHVNMTFLFQPSPISFHGHDSLLRYEFLALQWEKPCLRLFVIVAIGRFNLPHKEIYVRGFELCLLSPRRNRNSFREKSRNLF